MQENYIQRSYTNVIKGVALILMFAHHFFTFPDRIVDASDFVIAPWVAQYLHDPLKICVSIFAFLTGYTYYFKEDKSLLDSLRKTLDIYINYVIVLSICVVLGICLGTYQFTVKSLALELLFIDKPNMEFCWYVAFYILAMFILPFYARLARMNSVFAFSVGLVVPYMLVFLLDVIKQELEIGALDYLLDIIKYIIWFPCIASGLLFAQENLFFKMERLFLNRPPLRLAVSLLFVLVLPFCRCKNTQFDFIYAPLFVFGLIGLVKAINIGFLLPVSIIGKYSMLMWFFHCAFFNVSKSITQPVLYYPRFPILVLLWGLILCLVPSYIVSFAAGWITKIKNKVLNKLFSARLRDGIWERN